MWGYIHVLGFLLLTVWGYIHVLGVLLFTLESLCLLYRFIEDLQTEVLEIEISLAKFYAQLTVG